MLKVIRKKGVIKTLIWIVAIVIIISFGFLATAYLVTGNTTSGYAGKIYGKKISFQKFDSAYAQVLLMYRLQYLDKFNEIRPYLDMDSSTWDRLILMHEVDKRNIQAEDAEVIETIQNYPFFQRDGRFDTLLYNDILRGFFRVKPRDFEESIRKNVRFGKLYDEITGDITATETEVLEAFRKQNERIQVSYALISPEQFKDEVQITEDQAKAYYEENKEQFRVPPSINVEYITLKFPPMDNINIPVVDAEEPSMDAELAEQEREEAIEALKEPVREKAYSIAQDLLINPKFEEAAKTHELEIKTSGFFSRAEPNLSLGWPFESLNNIFALDVNDTTDAFETSEGVVIAKIKEKRESYVPEYEEVKSKVKDALLNLEASRIAFEKAQSNLVALKVEMDKTQLDDFTDAAKQLGLDIHQTPAFTHGQYLPKIGISNEFQAAAFALSEENNVSNVVAVSNGYVILHLDGREPADESTYPEQREAIANALINERKNTAFNEFSSELRLRANLEDNIAALRKQQQQ